jgi:hypothetical protein
MVKLTALIAVLLVPFTGFSQEARTWVYVSRAGQDLIGSRFEAALKDELSRSTRFRPRYSEGAKTKFEFHIDLGTVDVSDVKEEQGKKSVVSVVIEESGLPNSYPVATMWYHKVIVVDKDSVSRVAKDLLFVSVRFSPCVLRLCE